MNVMDILIELWRHHKGKTIGIALGLIFGIMVVSFGFWQALFIYFCVFIGFIIGKRIDNRTSIKETVERIFSAREK